MGAIGSKPEVSEDEGSSQERVAEEEAPSWSMGSLRRSFRFRSAARVIEDAEKTLDFPLDEQTSLERDASDSDACDESDAVSVDSYSSALQHFTDTLAPADLPSPSKTSFLEKSVEDSSSVIPSRNLFPSSIVDDFDSGNSTSLEEEKKSNSTMGLLGEDASLEISEKKEEEDWEKPGLWASGDSPSQTAPNRCDISMVCSASTLLNITSPRVHADVPSSPESSFLESSLENSTSKMAHIESSPTMNELADQFSRIMKNEKNSEGNAEEPKSTSAVPRSEENHEDWTEPGLRASGISLMEVVPSSPSFGPFRFSFRTPRVVEDAEEPSFNMGRQEEEQKCGESIAPTYTPPIFYQRSATIVDSLISNNSINCRNNFSAAIPAAEAAEDLLATGEPSETRQMSSSHDQSLLLDTSTSSTTLQDSHGGLSAIPTSVRCKASGDYGTVLLKNLTEKRFAYRVKIVNAAFYKLISSLGFIEPGNSKFLQFTRNEGPANGDRMVVYHTEVSGEVNNVAEVFADPQHAVRYLDVPFDICS